MQISQSTSNGLFDWILKYHSPVLTTLYFCQILIINQLFLSYRTWLIYTEPSQFLVITSLLAEDRWMLYKSNVGISESIKNSSKTVTVINYYQILMTFSGILCDIWTSLIYLPYWQNCVTRRSYYEQPERRHDASGLLLSRCSWWSRGRACPEVRRFMSPPSSTEVTIPRYNLSSCNTLEPVYVEENWQAPGVAMEEEEEEDSGLFDNPRRSRKRNPPFEIIVNFDQYRRNRKYQGKKWVVVRESFPWQNPRSPPDHQQTIREFRLVPPAGPGSRAERRERQPGGDLHVSPAQHQQTSLLPGPAELQPHWQGPPRPPAEPDLHLALAQLRSRRHQVHGLNSPE